MQMQIEYWDIERLLPYAKKPRKNDQAVEKVAAAIKEFGFRVPVIARSDNEVIDGHLRLKAARHLGMTQVPVLVADDMTPAQVKAFRISVNRMAELAEWDLDALRLEVQDLSDSQYDLTLTGLDEEMFSGLMLSMDHTSEGLTDEDEVPDLPADPIVRLGDIWAMGEHLLMCGDATSIEDVGCLMAGLKAGMVFTDPPYGVKYQSNSRVKSAKFDVLKNDDTELDIFPIIERYSVGWVFIWTTWKVVDRWLVKTSGFGPPSNMIVWHKGGGGLGDLKGTFSTDWELALVFNRGADLCGKRIGSVWSIGKDAAALYVHPTQKPVALGVEAIDKTTQKGAMILDLFGGSGSTLIACEKTGRKARLMELDPKYCDVIVRRWEKFTGKEAVLVSADKTFAEMAAAR